MGWTADDIAEAARELALETFQLEQVEHWAFDDTDAELEPERRWFADETFEYGYMQLTDVQWKLARQEYLRCMRKAVSIATKRADELMAASQADDTDGYTKILDAINEGVERAIKPDQGDV